MVSFQYPEGHSSYFHSCEVDHGGTIHGICFSTPKGIPHISTRSLSLIAVWLLRFQYPEGHSSYFHSGHWNYPDKFRVTSFSTPKGIPHISTQGRGCDWSVGGRRCLFQYPEGHSSYFHNTIYLPAISNVKSFSTPKGIPHISTRRGRDGRYDEGCFSTPKGIPHISTSASAAADYTAPVIPLIAFQYPEGHSSYFHAAARSAADAAAEAFQYPEGHSSYFHSPFLGTAGLQGAGPVGQPGSTASRGPAAQAFSLFCTFSSDAAG